MTKEQEKELYERWKRERVFDDPVAAIEAESRRLYMEQFGKQDASHNQLVLGTMKQWPNETEEHCSDGTVKYISHGPPAEQGPLLNWKPIEWTGGPVQIHDVRFVWWYRVWLWFKFSVLHHRIGFYASKPAAFTAARYDYDAMVIDYRPKHMKKSKSNFCKTMENNPPR